MKVAFYTGRLEFDGDALETVGLGGSESALINLTRAWKINHPEDNLVVYSGNTKRPVETYNDISYKTLNDFLLEYKYKKYDAFISLRDSYPFKLPFINSTIKCLWSQDDMNEIGLKELHTNSYWTENIDCIFSVSEYAKNNIQQSFPKTKIFLQRNGYNKNWIKHDFNTMEEYYKYMKEKEYVCIYTSTPFRGLDVLAEVWPIIYRECYERYNIQPILRIFSGMSLYKRSDKDFDELYEKLKVLKNVELYKPIPQKELYEELAKAKVMLYSNNFLETSCMAICEALANHVWVITTDLGALSEQVVDNVNGYTIPGDSRTQEYQKQFIDLSVESICLPTFPNNKNLIFSWDEQSELMRNRIKEMI